MLREEERQSKKFMQAATLSLQKNQLILVNLFFVYMKCISRYSLYMYVYTYILKNTLYLWLDVHVFLDVSVWFFMQ